MKPPSQVFHKEPRQAFKLRSGTWPKQMFQNVGGGGNLWRDPHCNRDHHAGNRVEALERQSPFKAGSTSSSGW